jgi:trans-aconitate methyltransferase
VAPRRALDFGCGVGRLTAPLARRAGAVVGVDIAPTMLQHARQRCTECGLLNTSFARSDPQLTEVGGTFDFIHSFIVFQHIPPDVGYQLLDTLLLKLEPSGVGALHFTYARRASLVRKLVHRLRRRSRMAHMAVNLVQGVPPRFPMMPMYEYDLPRLVSAITATGVRDVLIRHTDHGGHIGALLVFQKPPVAHQ